MKNEILKLGILFCLSFFSQQIYAESQECGCSEYQDLKVEAQVYESERSRRDYAEEFKFREIVEQAEEILLAEG